MHVDGLVGRERQLALLSQAITSAREGGAALLLTGERGIGKTTCLATARELAQAVAHLVLETSGSETEVRLPFAGLHRLLRPILSLSERLVSVQRSALLVALGMEEGESPDLLTVSLATLNLLNEAARENAMLVCVDDLPWLDDVSRHVLTFVARRIERRPIVLIATASKERGMTDVAGAFLQVDLDRLDDSAAHRLLARRAVLLEPVLRAWVVDLAVGNPLALVELAAMRQSYSDPLVSFTGSVPPLTPALRHAFGGRLEELPAPSRDALLVAALASDDLVQETLAATALLMGHDVTVTVLDPPKALGLLDYDERRVTFTHPLVRAAVAQSEPLNRRQAAHRALGETVVVSSSRRTWHRANGAAGYDDMVAAELELLSIQSIRAGEPAAAVLALERAAQLSTSSLQRGRQLILAAKQCAEMGRFELVDRLLATALGEDLAATDRAVADLLMDDYTSLAAGDSDQVLQICAAAQRAEVEGRHDLALELTRAAGVRRVSAQLNPLAVQAVEQLVGVVAYDHADPRALAVRALVGPLRNGREVIDALAGIDHEDVTDPTLLEALAAAARAVGDYARASIYASRAEAAFRERALGAGVARVLCVVADVSLDLGDWAGADSALAELAAMTPDSSRAVHRFDVLVTAAKAAALRGDAAAALDIVSEVEHDSAVRSGSSVLARAQIARGIAHIASGMHLEAFGALSRVFKKGDPSHHFREQLGAVTFLAEAAVRCGQSHEAREILGEMDSLAESSGSPLLLAQLGYARAVLAQEDHTEHVFLEQLASDLAEWPWQRARLQLAYGRWLRRQRQVTRSRGPLQSSRVTLQSLGADHWSTEAIDELEAAGVSDMDRPQDAEPGAIPLSAQELKIARLAAAGLTNGEIGQQLCLSPRTVASHLYRTFPKLGISARREISSKLTDLLA